MRKFHLVQFQWKTRMSGQKVFLQFWRKPGPVQLTKQLVNFPFLASRQNLLALESINLDSCQINWGLTCTGPKTDSGYQLNCSVLGKMQSVTCLECRWWRAIIQQKETVTQQNRILAHHMIGHLHNSDLTKRWSQQQPVFCAFFDKSIVSVAWLCRLLSRWASSSTNRWTAAVKALSTFVASFALVSQWGISPFDAHQFWASSFETWRSWMSTLLPNTTKGKLLPFCTSA